LDRVKTLSHDVESMVLRLCEDLGTPRSLAIAIMVRNREWDQLSVVETDPLHYLNAESYWLDRQASDILRKYQPLPTSFDRKAVAIENFWKCERQCYRTNERLQQYVERVLNPYDTEGVLPFVREVRKVVANLLGPCPDLPQGRFGPGATYADRGQFATVPHKMSSAPTLTPDAWPFLMQWSGTQWASACASSGKGPVFVNGNRFLTVPKDCRKDRAIAVEPSINVFYQLGYGRIIRSRLRNRGLDLDLGQDIHRRLACEASTEGHLATLDLSNASDTISKNLVKLLLPTRWYEALDMLRSKKTLIEGKSVFLEKFSSMGNGFTFELETLLFACIALVASGGTLGLDVFAFGDDLIIPSHSSKDVISALKFFGMTINEEKSFVDGPFRESCGGDYFLGVDVRPHYLKEEPLEPQHFIALANGLARSCKGYAHRRYLTHRTWLHVVNWLPVDLRRCRGPDHLGDLVLHEEQVEGRWQTRWRHGIRYFRCYRPARFRKIPYARFSPEVTLACATYGLGWNDGGVTPRNSVLGYKVGWVASS
jgi:hypothetical protein